MRIFILGALALMIFLTAGCSETAKYDKNVLLVREGTMYMSPNVPVGKAFDQFFGDGKWKSFTSTENETIVEFNGDCTFEDKPATFRIQFSISGNEFQMKYVAINNVPLTYLDGLEVLEKVFEEYQP